MLKIPGSTKSAKMRNYRCRGERLEDRKMLDGASLLISEFMASNNTILENSFRDYSDWLEIHNPTDQSVSVLGWHLTDDAEELEKWQLPDVSIEPQGSLIVFASGADQVIEGELHTNFKLSSGGEYLGLVRPDNSIAHEYKPEYPEQSTDISYGLVFNLDGTPSTNVAFFAEPTPGAANQAEGSSEFAPDVVFSANRGYYDNPFEVSLTNNLPGSSIRFTTDGTAPTLDNGTLYEGPITISTTTTLRAASFGANLIASDVMTHTYLFMEDILQQDGSGLPEEWGHFDDIGPRPPARVKANYGVDPDVVNHEDYKDTIREDIRSLPTLSLVMDPDDLWEFENGIYSNPMRVGEKWERPVSMEWINQDGSTAFQENAGIRIHGGWARRFSQTKKLSFRVAFRGQYGSPTLDYPLFGEEDQTEFQAIVLRGGFNDSYRDGGSGSNTYTQDQWTRQAQRDLGGFTSRNNYVQLYLNGLYWGMYSPTERMNAEWAAQTMGGDPDEWTVINTGANLIDGNQRDWTDFSRLFRSRLDYDAIKNELDIEDFIDYLMVNQFVGNWDWPHNNWYASKRNVEGGKWRFHSWDAEAAFQNGIGEDRVNNATSAVGPAQVYLALRDVPEFQRAYADRINKHFSATGKLNAEANIARLNAIADQIDRAMVGESARWGDGRNDSGRPILQSSWVRRIDTINRRYFEPRIDRMYTQYDRADLYPSIASPTFDPPGGEFQPDKEISLTTDLVDGELFYTLDGSDPQGPNGQISPTAIGHNAQNMVDPNSLAKIQVPTGPIDGWNTNDFDDSDWSTGTANVGFDTGFVEDAISAPDGFDIVEYISDTRLNTVEQARALLDGGDNLVRKIKTRDLPVINFLGGLRGGNFDGNLDFPNGVDNFASEITGKILVNKAGTYTFLITSNDAADLEINGTVVFADDKRHATRNAFVTAELTAGLHDVRLFYYDRTGSAVLEFAYATGEKTEFDDSFKIVGDTQHRSYDGRYQTDLQAAMLDKNSSAYLRIPFQANNIADLDALLLNIEYEDGFIAYLNGDKVASRFAPETPAFDSTATDIRFDVDAIQPEIINLSESLPSLKEGDNLLAIQLLNSSTDDADLLITPRLIGLDNDRTFTLTESSTLKARVFARNIWSAITEVEFTSAVPASSADLRISELSYHPSDPTAAEVAAGFNDADSFDFVEIVNISNKLIDLSDLAFETAVVEGDQQGILFEFADSDVTKLAPGERVVVVEDRLAFEKRYGDDLPVAGQWSGGLDNGGETILLKAGEGTVQSFAYADDWYPETDGQGKSLEVIAPATTAANLWGTKATWQASIPTPGLGYFSPPGDANRDGQFNSDDLVLVFQSAEYEDGIVGNSDWSEGDWDGDGEFGSKDLVLAFQFGAYEEAIAARLSDLSEPISNRLLEKNSPDSPAALADLDDLAALKDRVFQDDDWGL